MTFLKGIFKLNLLPWVGTIYRYLHVTPFPIHDRPYVFPGILGKYRL
jgi:hypothetical protein